MKFKLLHTAILSVLAGLMIGCGAGHPKIVSIAVSPATASATIVPRSDVQFTAQATFDNRTSRELTVADGLSWTSSNTSIATINSTGSATCLALGQVTITATAPADLSVTVSNGVQNTSTNVSGTAQLSCLATP